jgi:hypothetical protein
MWPFSKKNSTPPPRDFFKDGMTSKYDIKLKTWSFENESIEFNLSGIPFDENAFQWSKEASAIIRKLDNEIKGKVMECLEGWPCNKTTAKILVVNLNDYRESKSMDIAFVGDETWGDFGVNVIVTNGQIVDVYGGD